MRSGRGDRRERLLCGPSLTAQWLKYPTAGVPRTRDGKPNLTGPAPRTREGTPDVSGLWLTADGLPCNQQSLGSEFLVCGAELPISRYGINMGAGMPQGLPYQPWAAEQVKYETEQNSKDDPHARCLPDTFVRLYGLPHIQKFVQTPGLLVMLDELNAGYRQVFTDGRPLPHRSRNPRGRDIRPANGQATRSSSIQSDSGTSCGWTSSAAR